MAIQLKPFIAPPKTPRSSKGVRKKSLKPNSQKRRPLPEVSSSNLFGSKLFEPIAKREKEIVITFHPQFTLDLVKISKDGKFCIKHFAPSEEKWVLVILKDPIIFQATLTLEKICANVHEIFECFGEDGLSEVQDLIVKCIRKEIASDKENLKSKKEQSFQEGIRNELAERDISEQSGICEPPSQANVEQDTKKEEIPQTGETKKLGINLSGPKVIKAGIFSLKKDVSLTKPTIEAPKKLTLANFILKK